MMEGEKQGWTGRRGRGDKVFWALCALCAVLVLADAVYVKHPIFEIETWFGFYTIIGFFFCAGLVLLAKALRCVLRRKEDYYDD